MNTLIIDQIYYVVIPTLLLFYLYFQLIPTDKKRLPKWYHLKWGMKYEDYDWEETIRRQKKFINISQIYLTLFFILSKIVGDWNGKVVIGDWIAKIGLLSYCVLAIVLSFKLNPMKK